MSNRFKTMIIGIVAVGWLINLAMPAVIHDYKPDPSVNAPFMLVLAVVVKSYDKSGGGKK